MTSDALPHICSTLEDVVRAAPEAGFYPVASVDGCGAATERDPGEWTMASLRVDAGGTRTWWLFGWECELVDAEAVGWRIGPRIRMPGEGE